MKKNKMSFALIAALLYAVNIPISKLLLLSIGPTLLAGFLYLGAGVGMAVFFLLEKKNIEKKDLLSKKELPYTVLMVVLDVAAPICLMYGLSQTNASGVSLLNNFEIVATAIIALVIFKEKISCRLWIAIILITISSFLLSIYDLTSLELSKDSLFVLLATTFWGLENNCTRKLSNKNTYEIVMIKGLCCGVSSLIIGFSLSQKITQPIMAIFAMALGFVSYGLSIFFYIRAQKEIGAAKTSAFYAINPFIGSLFSAVILGEDLKWNFYLSFSIMLIGTIFIVIDTMRTQQFEK